MNNCPNCGRQTLRTKDWACQWCGYPLISRAFKTIDKTYKELQEERSLNATLAQNQAEELDDYEPELETEPETKPEPEPERRPEMKSPPGQERNGSARPKPEPKPKFRFFRKPRPTQPRPRPETKHEPEPEPEIERDEPEFAQPETPPRPVNRQAPIQRQSPPAPVSRPEPKPEPPPLSTQKTVEELLSTPELPPGPKAEPAPQLQYKPEPSPAPAPNPPPAPAAGQSASPAAPPPAAEPPPSKPEIVIEYQPPPVASIKLDDIKDGMEITSDDLDALFRLDKAGTNIKLNGKTITVKGVVEKVFIKEHLDIRYIVINGKKKLLWSERCTFNKEDSGKAGRLNEGSEVAIKGKYDGYGKNIIFKDCQVV